MSEWSEYMALVAANFHEHQAKRHAKLARHSIIYDSRKLALEYARVSAAHSGIARQHREAAAKFRPNPDWVTVGPAIHPPVVSVEDFQNRLLGEWSFPPNTFLLPDSFKHVVPIIYRRKVRTCGCTDATGCPSCHPENYEIQFDSNGNPV